MTTREAAGIINVIKCGMVTTPAEHEALTMAECVLLKAEPKHGRWIEDEYGIPHCSNCGTINNTVYRNYCPNCGERMDK